MSKEHITEEKGRFNVVEAPDAIERYNKLKALGESLIGVSETLRRGIVAEEDVARAREFLAKGARETNPPVWANYWEHILIAPELGRRIATAVQRAGLAINPLEIEFMLWLHDIGRLVTPAEYLRNDLIGDRLLRGCGVTNRLLKNSPPIAELMAVAERLKFSFQEQLTSEQEKEAQKYFDSLSPAQRITNYADNFGKRGPNGLFNLNVFVTYLTLQEGRYDQESQWASVKWAIPRRQAGAVLQAHVIGKTLDWFQEIGVDLKDIQNELKDYGPKIVVIARHGELNNPTGIVYNRDSVMQEEDIIHLSDEGRRQMQELADLLQKRRFKCTRILTSPEIRTREACEEMRNQLGIGDFRVDEGLDDAYAPGPYQEKMAMKKLAEIGGDVYEESRWGKYGHEKPREIVERMGRAFWQMVKDLKTGVAGILVSHGDPIAWLANSLVSGEVPSPQELRELIYPAKGEALVAVIGPQDELFTMYLLNGDDVLKKGKIY